MTNLEAYAKMLQYLERGIGVLTAGEIHPDIPLIHDIGHQEGRRLRTLTEVRHLGFGFFSATVPSGKIGFDGGGAMVRAETFSWCPFTGPIEETGYDLEAAKKAVDDLYSHARAS